MADELRIRHANGAFTRWLDILKNMDVLVLDDRAGRKSTIITSQFPIEHWHEWIGDATVAEAMLHRIMQNHQRLALTGESLRKTKPNPKMEEIQG